MAETRTTPGVKTALTIAGSDSSGGAGIQADLKTFTVLRVFGASVITAVTAQNTQGVRAAMILEPELIEQQIDAVAGDLRLGAVKTGMLGNRAVIETVAAGVGRHALAPLVVDPVMVAKTGAPLIDQDAVKTLCRRLLPLAAIVTPNGQEAARLLGEEAPVRDLGRARGAARAICERFGARACLVKGIHRPAQPDDESVDVFFDGQEAHEVVGLHFSTQNTHGSGCALSAAITAALALGQPLDQAVQTAKKLVSEAIRQATDLGSGRGPINVMTYLDLKK